MGQCYLFYREEGHEASIDLSSCHTQSDRDRLNLPSDGATPCTSMVASREGWH